MPGWRPPRTAARWTPPARGARSCTTAPLSGRGSSSRRSPGSRTTRSSTPDTVTVDYDRDLGYPGVFPFTRGVYPSMYRGKLWTMRQFAGFGTAAETNERFRYLLDHGQTGLSTAFDMPTLMGYDSDHPAVGGRGRARGCRDRLARGHGDALPRHPARRCLDVDDDQLAGGDPARVLHRGGGGAGCAGGASARDDPDGHPQGVHRAEGVHLPARAVDAAGDRHGRVLLAGAAEVASDLDLGLPHPRGRVDGGAGARLHASATASPMSSGRSSVGWMSTSSRRGSRSSSTRIWTSSRRSRSTGPRAGSGRASCATVSAPATRAPG